MAPKVKGDLVDIAKGSGVPIKNEDELFDWLAKEGVVDNQFRSELGAAFKRREMGKGRSILRSTIGADSPVLKGGYKLAQGNENMFRVGFFFDRIKDGMLPEDAVDDVLRVFFDYSDLTRFEQGMQKYLYFYNFYRNNFRYIVKTLRDHPQISKQVLKLFEGDPDNPSSTFASQRGSFDAAMKNVALGFIPQQQFGMFSTEGENFHDILSDKLGDIAAAGNPMITNGLELAFGRELYTGKDIRANDKAEGLQWTPQWFKDAVGYRKEVAKDGTVKHTMNPTARFWMNVVPFVGRSVQQLALLENKDRNTFEKTMQILSGVRIADRDLTAESLAKAQRNLNRAAEDVDTLGRNPVGRLSTDTRTEAGKVLSALYAPTKDKILDLGYDPEILAIVDPYVRMDKDGRPILTADLKDKLREIALQKAPSHVILLDAQKVVNAARESSTAEGVANRKQMLMEMLSRVRGE